MLHKFVLLLLILITMTVLAPVTAQNNLLTNAGFETEGNWSPIDTSGGGFFAAPPGWGGWLDPASVSVPNAYPHRRAFVDDDASETEIGIANGINSFIRSGNFSANIGRGGGAFTGAIYQQASVPEGSNVVGSAWVIMNLPDGANLQARVGIDPNGGTNPGDTDVVWSSWATNQIGSHTQLSASATATGPSVTIFLYFRTQSPTDPNAMYWDDASLIVGGAGGAAPGAATAAPANTPVPTAPPVAQFVVPQGARDDGSIVHTVQSGDTLSAIAVAYGMMPDEIIALNNITDARLIRVGQELLIRPAPGGDDEGDGGAGEEEAPVEEEQPIAEEQPAEEQPAEQEDNNDGGEAVAQAPTTEPEPEDEPTEEEPTPEPTPTTAATATPRPTSPPAPVAEADTASQVDLDARTAAVCVTLFEDSNMNRIQESGEANLNGGTISLNKDGAPMNSMTTDSSPDPLCFDELEVGEYTALAAAPQGYGLTTADQRLLRLQPGATVNVAFGAAEGVEMVNPPPAGAANVGEITEQTVNEEDEGQLVQYIGIILFALAGVTLLGGIGVTLALRRR